MRLSCFFCHSVCSLLVCMLAVSVAFADIPDISSLTNDELVLLLETVNAALVSRGIEKSATLPAGKYTAGKDFPAGSYIITCRTDDNHHGIVWVSAPTDDLDNDYPSILYKHVSFNSEEMFRVTIEEGGVLSLPFMAILTISAGLLFK